MPWCSVVLFCFLVLCLCVCFCAFCLVGGFCVFVVGVLGVLLVGCGSVLGVFWVFGGGFRLFLGLFFGVMVLGVFWVSGPVWKVAFSLVSAFCTGVHFLHFGGL